MHDRWRFYPPASPAPLVVRVTGDRSADDAEVVRRRAVAGQGVAYKSRLDVSDDLRAGRLQVLLPEIAGEPAPLHLLCLHRAQVTPTVMRLRDFLRTMCEELLTTRL